MSQLQGIKGVVQGILGEGVCIMIQVFCIV